MGMDEGEKVTLLRDEPHETGKDPIVLHPTPQSLPIPPRLDTAKLTFKCSFHTYYHYHIRLKALPLHNSLH